MAEMRGRCRNYLFGLRDPESREAMCFEIISPELSGCRNSIVEMRQPIVWATPTGVHVYEIEWTDDGVLFYVCGQLVHRSTPSPATPHIPDVSPGFGEIALHEVSGIDMTTGATTYIVGGPEPAAAASPSPDAAPEPAGTRQEGDPVGG